MTDTEINHDSPVPAKDRHSPALSPVLVQLLKGIIYRDTHPNLWQDLQLLEAQVTDYLLVLGLKLHIDESEGYAFLLQSLPGEGEASIPRLIQRRPLSYPVSLLCVLLRKQLVESDHQGESFRIVITRDEIINLLQVFLPEQANEARLIEQIDSHIRKVVELGFLKKLKEQNHYEIRRILKSLVDADWLADLSEKLEVYHQHACSDS